MAASIAFRGITKRFPGVVALDDVSFEIAPGSCHALLGENGAGKSTLGKILSGIYQPDAGHVEIDGMAVSFAGPHEASLGGVSIVHQELLFCENLSVAENLFLGATPAKGPWVDWETARARSREWLDRIGAGVDPDEIVGNLSLGVRQLVQIAGAVGRGARIVVFDEPTSSLSKGEVDRLYTIIDQLKAEGTTCVYVSHRMDEIFRLCDAVTVLRDGKFVKTTPTAETSREELVKLMVGRAIDETRQPSAAPGETVLSVRELSSPKKFEHVSFEIKAGEIVGFGGLIGAGRTEIAEAIFGMDGAAHGEILLGGKPLVGAPEERIRAGVAYVTEDRKRLGLVMSFNVRENESLASLSALTRLGFVRRNAEESLTEDLTERLDVKTPDVETNVGGLSGGNQQKVVLAKWLAERHALLILDEPTRGVDVVAKAEIHERIRALAREGYAVMVISSELPELLSVADRILVMREGRLVGEWRAEDATEEILLGAMAHVQIA